MSLRGSHGLVRLVVLVALGIAALVPATGLASRMARLPALAAAPAAIETTGTVTVQRAPDGSFRYLVNGTPQTFIGMGYNPIYRHLSDEQRAANYDRDFGLLAEAGVNHITGWDADKGYEQDKFDELTLDYAHKYGLGVVMPFFLPADGDYEDRALLNALLQEAALKIERFRDHPALRMWGVGNEVLTDMPPSESNRETFLRFRLQLADLFHALDPNHPVIYREAEDTFVPEIKALLELSGRSRPWLVYGTNVYSQELERILKDWPSHGLDVPLVVSEFGAEPDWLGSRSLGYVAMWRAIRQYPDYVLGGAPYVWTTEGPEPVDRKWGLMDAESRPVDDTFELLAGEWRQERGAEPR